jgi:glucose/arabinose dehydrogenase
MVTLGPAQAQPDGPLPPSELEVGFEQVVGPTGLRLTGISAPDDGTGRLFVIDKDGRVLVLDPATGELDTDEPLLDISDRVRTQGNEQGLLGIAPSPNFAENQRLFVSYTADAPGAPGRQDGALTLSRFDLGSDNPEDTEELVIRQEHNANSNHNGGDLMFGPKDGYLYWSTGDGGSNRDPFYGAQNLSALFGKIVRIDVTGECDGRLYCIPATNPFMRGEIARPEIWAYGLRNPWRFSIDPVDNSLWIADVGQNRWEEINHTPIQPRRNGWNFGWSCFEGTEELTVQPMGNVQPDPFVENRCLPGAQYVDPIFTYSIFDTPRQAVMGGFVYRGQEFADIADGTYVATDYTTGQAFAIQQERRGRYLISDDVGDLPPRVTSFGVDRDGEIYFVTDGIAGGQGEIFRLTFEAATP